MRYLFTVDRLLGLGKHCIKAGEELVDLVPSVLLLLVDLLNPESSAFSKLTKPVSMIMVVIWVVMMVVMLRSLDLLD